jgi:hypothetical protein
LIAHAINERAYTLPEANDVEAAQRAFVAGVFTLIVDGEQVCKLDERLCLQPTSKVTLLRRQGVR